MTLFHLLVEGSVSLLREITNSASEAINFLIIIHDAQQATQIKDKINVKVPIWRLEDDLLVKQDALEYHPKSNIYFMGEFQAASNGAPNNIYILTYLPTFKAKKAWPQRLVLEKNIIFL